MARAATSLGALELRALWLRATGQVAAEVGKPQGIGAVPQKSGAWRRLSAQPSGYILRKAVANALLTGMEEVRKMLIGLIDRLARA